MTASHANYIGSAAFGAAFFVVLAIAGHPALALAGAGLGWSSAYIGHAAHETGSPWLALLSLVLMIAALGCAVGGLIAGLS